jgi:hypothetical protein
MTFDKLKPGMTLYDVHSHQMGNTTMRSIGIWNVQVLEVNEDRTILASWNGNKPATMYERDWKKLRLKKPELIRSGFGSYRIKPRAPSIGCESGPITIKNTATVNHEK